MRTLDTRHPSAAALVAVRALVQKYGGGSIVAAIQALARSKADGAQSEGLKAEAIELHVLTLKLEEVALECPSGLAALAVRFASPTK